MVVNIKDIKAIEILDSRGNPTLMTKIMLNDGTIGTARVPSGASTGINEAMELRDGGDRFRGKGVLRAVDNVNSIIAKALDPVNPLSQKEVDDALLAADPSKGKAELGANAVLSVSMAIAVAAAKHLELELFEYLKTKVLAKDSKYLQPVPLSNVINGGAHAGNKLAIQEFMILPIGAPNIREALRYTSEVYHVLGTNMISKYGKMAKHVGDEGGFCGFGLETTRDAFEEIISAIETAGYTSGKDIVLGIDAAASGFYEDGSYSIDGKTLTPGELLENYLDLERTFPLVTVEDPFDENAFVEFAEYTKITQTQVVTDDLTVSNPKIVNKAIRLGAGNSLLLKVNQIGTVSEAIEAAKIANEAGWSVIVSHRSGETSDTFIADLAVALSTGQIKSGAPARTDRVAKYNRLLEIDDLLTGKCGYPRADFRTAWRDY